MIELIKMSSIKSNADTLPNNESSAANVPSAHKRCADFEEAIEATGYGRFNVLLLMIALPCCMSSVYESACISYIVPIAECDLKLSILDKGVLNAVSYAGMITSAIPWGYYADRFGRRKLLIVGLFLDALCMLASSLTRNVYMLMGFKYLGGLIMCGPFAVLMSYLSEFHGMKFRSSVMMVIGMFFSLATISLPSIGWLILPIPWSLHIGSVVSLKSWQMYLAVCALPGFIGSFGLIFMPESPRLLMTQGRYDEALDVMRTIYAWNNDSKIAAYPIHQLVEEIRTDPETEPTKESSKGLSAIIPLFHKPLLPMFCLVVIIQFCSLFGLNTMRLWLPQLYTIVTNNVLAHEAFVEANYTNNLCGMLAYSVNVSKVNLETPEWMENCNDPVINDSMYMNTIYSGLTGLGGYIVAGFLIKKFGTRTVLVTGLSVAGTCGICLYWAVNTVYTVILSSMYVSIGSICTTAFLGVIVNIFPTSLRALTISVGMMCGRMGALIGNVIFPYLLSTGCLPPFLMVGSVMMLSSILCMALPKSNTVALK